MKKVVVWALPRTGNQSMARALCLLGYDKVVHEPKDLSDLEHADAVVEACRFSPAAWVKRHPDALFVYLHRGLEPWLASCRRVAAPVEQVDPAHNWFWRFPELWPVLHAEALQAFTFFVPSGQRLYFHVREGWTPLCEFLDLSIPPVPFPNVDEWAVGGPRRGGGV